APPVAAGAAGPADLLAAAVRVRGRSYPVAAAAYQAWIAAGGNDGGQVAQFAYALANRSDFVHAAEWAERATTMDANSQLGWYVLGVARGEGRHDRAG